MLPAPIVEVTAVPVVPKEAAVAARLASTAARCSASMRSSRRAILGCRPCLEAKSAASAGRSESRHTGMRSTICACEHPSPATVLLSIMQAQPSYLWRDVDVHVHEGRGARHEMHVVPGAVAM